MPHDELWRETHTRALNHTLWMAVVLAQDVDEPEVALEIGSILLAMARRDDARPESRAAHV
jgi:hypothetical protein